MPPQQGLRERKKAALRARLADVAADLFAERGYEAVSIQDVARAADVSDQTVYNYFSAKQELVLDLVEEFRERYGRVVRDRGPTSTPADALRPLVEEDIERYRLDDPQRARGQFPAQSVASPALRRFTLEAREQQVETVSAAIVATTPGIHPVVARAHAAALISVIQSITDQIGTAVLAVAEPDRSAGDMREVSRLAFDDLDRTFRAVTAVPPPPPPTG